MSRSQTQMPTPSMPPTTITLGANKTKMNEKTNIFNSYNVLHNVM